MPVNERSEVKLKKRVEAHKWHCPTVHFHPAGSMIVSAGWDRTIKIWDEDGSLLKEIDRTSHSAPITCARWHPNGALIATTSADMTTCLWDASTGRRMRTLKEHFGWVMNCSFAPDRTKLATASWDKTVRLWDPNTGDLISTLRGHTKGVYACAFYPVGHTSALLASGADDNTARLWDTRTRKIALTLTGGHADAIQSIAWANDGSLIATGSADQTVTLWDPKAGKVFRMFKGHGGAVKGISFSPAERDGINLLATAGGDSCFMWNPKSTANNLLAEVKQHDAGKEVEAVSISNNGKLIATGGRDGIVNISVIPDFPRDDYFDYRKQPDASSKQNKRISRNVDDSYKPPRDNDLMPTGVPKWKQQQDAGRVKEAVLTAEVQRTQQERNESIPTRKLRMLDDSGVPRPLVDVVKSQSLTKDKEAKANAAATVAEGSVEERQQIFMRKVGEGTTMF